MDINVFCGVDDGYRETKIVTSTGQCIRIPSQAKAGEMNQISINGGEKTVFPYSTSEGDFIIGDITEADATAFDDYPMSALNRVIVMHAMRKAGLKAGDLAAIATGLPVKKYFLGSDMNRKLLKSKKANLLKNDVEEILTIGGTKKLDKSNIPQIVKHEIVSEGIAAWMDVVLERGEDGKIHFNKELARERIAIIDIGGRTTDIAVISNNNLDTNRSSTLNMGMLNIENAVREEIYNTYEIQPSLEQMKEVMDNKRLKLWGEWVNVAKIVQAAEKSVVNSIKVECQRCLGNAADIDRVVFVGGTTVALEPYLEGWFRNQVIGDDPAFANARGMAKYIEVSNQKK